MIVHLAAMPAWGLALAEGAAVVILCITGRHIAEQKYRQGIPVGIVGLAAMLNFGGAIHQNWRLAAWLMILLSLIFSITAMGKRGKVFSDYQATRAKYGDRSRQVTVYTWKLIARMLFIAAALMGLYALLSKAA